MTALSGGESVEEAYALGKLLREGLGANAAVLPEDVPDWLDAFRAPLSALRDAEDDRRPLRRAGRRARAGRRPLAEGGAPQGRDDHLRRARRARSTRSSPTTPTTSGSARTNVYYLPRTPNGRGVTDAWSAAGDGEPVDAEPKLLVISGDEAATDPSVRALAEHADAVIGIGMFEESFRGLADLVLPRHELPRARRHDDQPRGPAAAPAPRRARARARRARLGREARRALRRRALAARLGRLRRDLRALLRRHHLRRGRRARRRCRRAPSAQARRPPARATGRRRRACASSPTGRSSPAPPSSARPSCSSSGRPARCSSRARTRTRARSATGRR